MKEKEIQAPSFLVKLMKILRSKEYSKIINWDAQTQGIKILNAKRLEEEILPRYYRHKNIKSFIRQLNMYDFHKVYLDDERSIFSHQTFDPRKKDSISSIKRKVPQDVMQKNSHALKECQKQNGTSSWKSLLSRKKCQKAKDHQTKKEDLPIKRSSFKLLFKNPFVNNSNRQQQQLSVQQALDQVISQIIPLNLSEDSIRQKIYELRKYSKFRKFLKSGSFLCKIYSKLGVQMDRDEDKLSDLSIQEELDQFNDKKIEEQSFKLIQSHRPPIFNRDTIGNFL